ncbi:hypothetical protein P280DRAFT_468262 [Massarina eburnea CBS 473.64]|uniref:RBR-type E3 ubiquitin transferase n=1 Tax=Massarina eburnea CBS 473.64 TaxID=1395130 RepID=A0A6A6S2D7_9PLEO|nr:hypothetical protein P280DRAFT_468262 [Massarina eburnea CBS 473.64]
MGTFSSKPSYPEPIFSRSPPTSTRILSYPTNHSTQSTIHDHRPQPTRKSNQPTHTKQREPKTCRRKNAPSLIVEKESASDSSAAGPRSRSLRTHIYNTQEEPKARRRRPALPKEYETEHADHVASHPRIKQNEEQSHEATSAEKHRTGGNARENGSCVHRNQNCKASVENHQVNSKLIYDASRNSEIEAGSDIDEDGKRQPLYLGGEKKRTTRRQRSDSDGLTDQNRETENNVDRHRTARYRKPRSRAASSMSQTDSRHTLLSRHRHQSRPKDRAIYISITEVDNGGEQRMRECAICTDTLSLSHFSRRAPTSSCTHSPGTCRSCLRTWLTTCFKNKLWDQLNCPECMTQLQHADVKRFASRKVFEKYDELATRAAMEAIEGFRWCVVNRKRGKKRGSKGGGCGSGQVHGLGAKMECIGCGNVQCVKHGVVWHEGETCGEYDYRTDRKIKKAEEEASKRWIEKTAKKCPNCRWNIEKANGCDHMTCSKCRHEFCWLCLAAYAPIREQGNRMHREDCQYHSNNTR